MVFDSFHNGDILALETPSTKSPQRRYLCNTDLPNEPVYLPLCPLSLVARIDNHIFTYMLYRIVWLPDNHPVAVRTASFDVNAAAGFQLLGPLHHDAMDNNKLPINCV